MSYFLQRISYFPYLVKCWWFFGQLWHKSFLYWNLQNCSSINFSNLSNLYLKVTWRIFNPVRVDLEHKMDREYSQPEIIHPPDAAILRRVAFFHKRRIKKLRRTRKVKKISERLNARWKSFDVRRCYTPNRLKQIKINAVSLSQVG